MRNYLLIQKKIGYGNTAIHKLVHKIGQNQISPFSAAKVGRTDKMKQKKRKP